MTKEKFEKGSTYVYNNVQGYAYASNKLVLETGLLVRRVMDKYTPDFTTYGTADKNGYLRTKIDGKNVFVHRLVAIHFIPNKDNLAVVDHINENKQDNQKDNLRWVTLEDNTSRTNIRDVRALNEAREVYKEAKRKEVAAKAYYEAVEQEKEEIEKAYQKLAHTKELIKEELASMLSDYKKSADKLIEIASKDVARKEGRKVAAAEKKVRTRQEMIEDVGKQIKINNIVYPSVRAAARFIVSEERITKGLIRNIETVRKELRRIQTGVRDEGLMYEAYCVERV